MQGLQVLLAKNNEEELRKRRHQTGDDGAHKEQVEGAPLTFRLGGAGLEHRRPLIACATIIRRVMARFFSDTFGGSRAGEYQASVGVLRGAMARRM